MDNEKINIKQLGENIKPDEKTFYMVKTYRYKLTEGKPLSCKIHNVFTDKYENAIKQYHEQQEIANKNDDFVVVIYIMNEKKVKQQITKMLTEDDIDLNFVVCNYNEA